MHTVNRLLPGPVFGAGHTKVIEIDVVPAPKELTVSVVSRGSA